MGDFRISRIMVWAQKRLIVVLMHVCACYKISGGEAILPIDLEQIEHNCFFIGVYVCVGLCAHASEV